MNSNLSDALACEVLALLQRLNRKLVCAESCTAGLVAATLAGIPGASNSLCGSFVVYRNEAKIEWLGVPEAVLKDPTQGDVCEATAIHMARGALLKTPGASVAASVTGHLGPGSPEGLDGVAYLGWAERSPTSNSEIRARAYRIELKEPAPRDQTDTVRRVARQREAAREVLFLIRAELQQLESSLQKV